MPKGKRANSTAKKIICKVFDYFDKEAKKNKRIKVLKLSTKMAEATGYSKHTVERVLAECKKLKGAPFTSPKCYSKSRQCDDFDIDAIRRSVHDFYTRKEYPRLDKLLGAVTEKGYFHGGCISLWKLLRSFGFRYKKVNDKCYIYKQPRVVLH